MDRNEAIARIRTALKKRSGKTWSVTGGRGTAWGWIRIQSPPARRTDDRDSDQPAADPERRWYLTTTDRAELAALLGLESVHCQGEQVAASSDYRREYVERAETGRSDVNAQPYWD